MFPTDAPYAVYFDKAGAPLDNGYIYFGVENQNPETSPLQVYWDMAGTQPVAQPVRTIGGFPVRAGSIADVYANAAYSQTVRDSKGNLVRYAPSSTAQNPFGGTTSFALTDTEATSTTTSSFRFTRNANYPGGTPGYVNGCVFAETFVNNAAASAFEWTGVFVMHNQATAGENVGLYAQGIKYASAGPTWAFTAEIIDQNASNPASGVVGFELDVTADGTDTNKSRVGLDLVWRNRTGTGMHAGYGFRLNGSDANATLDIGFGTTPGAKLGLGIDLSAATISGAAVNLNTNQAINFGGNAGVPANTRQMFHNGTGYALANSAGTTYWILNDSGVLTCGAAGGATIADSLGLPMFKAQRVALAVNYLQVNNSTAGNAPGIYATGTDANVEFLAQGKGTLGVKLVDGAGGIKFQCNTTGLAFNGGGIVAKPTVTGAKGGNAALASLLTALASMSLLTDSTT